MRIVLDVPESLVGRMKDVIGGGSYDAPDEFVRTAIERQIEREESAEGGAKTLEEAIASVDGDTVDNSMSSGSSNEPETEAGQSTSDETSSAHRNGGEELSTDRRSYDGLPVVAPPDETRLDEGPLWGQYNRIFPVKFVVRGLANRIASRSDSDDEPWVPLPAFRNEIAHLARDIGSEIAEHDERVGRTRGEKLATGLPTSDDPDKSLERFRTHFVGRLEADDELTGAPPHLCFVDIASGSPQTIGLTEAGREFAGLPNPLLDEAPDADRSLSTEERNFYLAHVATARSDEYDAMQKVAQAITEGDDRPTSLTERVAFLNPDWSNSQADTIRSGLTSRMYELGLVDRQRVGQRGIAYELTEDGEAFYDDDEASRADDSAPTND